MSAPKPRLLFAGDAPLGGERHAALRLVRLPDRAELDEDEELSQLEAEQSRHRSRLAALGVAFLAHALLILLFALVVVAVVDPEPPQIEVAQETSSADVAAPAPRERRTLPDHHRSPAASAAAIPSITAAASADFAVPPVDETFPEAMDLGTPGVGLVPGFGGGPGLGGARFLGLAAGRESRHIVLLIDVSGSMRGNCSLEGLAAIKREVARTIGSLRPEIRFNLCAFASDVDAFRPASVRATEENKTAAIEWFDAYYQARRFPETRTSAFGSEGVDGDGVRYVPITSESFPNLRGIEGSTRIELGIFAAMRDAPQTIFVISDGEPMSNRRGRGVPDEELLDLIDGEFRSRYRVRNGVRINTISVDGYGERFLRRLAERFGGRYRSISPARL